MAAYNAGQLTEAATAEALRRRLEDEAPPASPQRIHVDARLQPWKWLQRSDGSYCKLDALDHSQGHDLIGCQPLAWDVAGAAVEFGLSTDQLERVARAAGERTGSLEVYSICYAAFMGGLWAMTGDAAAAERVEACRQALRALAARPGRPGRSHRPRRGRHDRGTRSGSERANGGLTAAAGWPRVRRPT